ncbi:Os01g0269550 [Oryza sativa Japonica Group]|uniref:Os01g0269550 protein n=2 Tax=Oryza sativa subsp. japonica TaxID=39947 RepID=C7IXV5_ORYSJ|nr:hypothetical protein EE612_001690 [Oryza sativa]BAH91003.1 Os01g0269550 [Oryza sativa Japonica Group]BAS71494.1 Os01g0269550 [Oryza sativa Japonica Group]|eukprot:NP_001172273.1 Os01g0269550 [Oryza sativa Japonica Group]
MASRRAASATTPAARGGRSSGTPSRTPGAGSPAPSIGLLYTVAASVVLPRPPKPTMEIDHLPASRRRVVVAAMITTVLQQLEDGFRLAADAHEAGPRDSSMLSAGSRRSRSS